MESSPPLHEVFAIAGQPAAAMAKPPARTDRECWHRMPVAGWTNVPYRPMRHVTLSATHTTGRVLW